ncbi:MAG: DNA-directed RNA polymerase subunit omega [Armatimonadota bacterium]|nr:DNA-directed RNA polymerase subunit omega [Armatimonadota bacterium]MDR5704276.1 DNA-directed RNA polymerase subunit omega [Armatimonadota bacterium]MDR7435754.1 DNA-directed RNA polymerase subunit omega [Armatimonadota bacterium]
MIDPPLEVLLERIPSKYALVIATTKRAHQINEGSLPLVDVDSTNPVTIALHEIAAGRIRVERPREL